uniref:Uncharacterized protein n=1 Tax=Arundo donax TaxID=35708 RepID=A0A0A9E230_ARUDO
MTSLIVLLYSIHSTSFCFIVKRSWLFPSVRSPVIKTRAGLTIASAGPTYRRKS